MNNVREILSIVCLVVAVISLVVVIFSFIIHTTLVGFIAVGVFALSFTLLITLGIPDDEDKGIIDYGRNDG